MALVHSHPGGLPRLSEADRRLQIKVHCPGGWSAGEIHKFRCVPHLTGRRFEHGVTDCYTLFRDAYHLAGIDMPDFEREDDWWRNGQNLYRQYGGHRLLPGALSSAQAGDILLCCFGASVANHAAIYCGNGELLHHLPEQLSKRERYSENGNDERIQPGVTATGTYLPSRGFTTIWPPPQPVREHGSGSHPCPVAADAGIPPSDERRLVPDTYSDSFTKPESGSGFVVMSGEYLLDKKRR